jgi:putative addiction module killer protein
MYATRAGKIPYREWFESLDRQVQFRIARYIARLKTGSAKGNIEALGEGVFELRIHFGPGYRVYFGESERTMILLLTGGSKRRQQADIETAKIYWRNYVTTN